MNLSYNQPCIPTSAEYNHHGSDNHHGGENHQGEESETDELPYDALNNLMSSPMFLQDAAMSCEQNAEPLSSSEDGIETCQAFQDANDYNSKLLFGDYYNRYAARSAYPNANSNVMSSPTNIFMDYNPVASSSSSLLKPSELPLSPMLQSFVSSIAPPSPLPQHLPPQKPSSIKKTKPRRFACPKCPSRFAIRSNLKRHLNTVHFDIRAFRCEVCHAAFGLKHNLRTHIRAKHERKRPFECEDCGANFGYKQVLKNHKKRCEVRRVVRPD